MPPNLPIRQNYCTLSVWSLLSRFNASARRTYLTIRAFGLRLRSVIHTAAPPTSQPRRLSLRALTVLLLSILAFNIKNYITRNENCQPKFTKRKNRRKVSRRSHKKEKNILILLGNNGYLRRSRPFGLNFPAEIFAAYRYRTVRCGIFAFCPFEISEPRSYADLFTARLRYADSEHLLRQKRRGSARPAVAQAVAKALIAKCAVIAVNIGLSFLGNFIYRRSIFSPRNIKILPKCSIAP